MLYDKNNCSNREKWFLLPRQNSPQLTEEPLRRNLLHKLLSLSNYRSILHHIEGSMTTSKPQITKHLTPKAQHFFVDGRRFPFKIVSFKLSWVDHKSRNKIDLKFGLSFVPGVALSEPIKPSSLKILCVHLTENLFDENTIISFWQ